MTTWRALDDPSVLVERQRMTDPRTQPEQPETPDDGVTIPDVPNDVVIPEDTTEEHDDDDNQ